MRARFRTTVWLVVAMAAGGFGAVATAEDRPGANALGPDAIGSERAVSQAVWAASLVRALGLASALSEEPEPAELFGLLCATQAEQIGAAGGDGVNRRSAFTTVMQVPTDRDPSQPIRLTVSLPLPAVYTLSAVGTGKQRWSIDQRVVGHLDPSDLGVAQANTVVPLRRGPHELTGILTSGARADRVEITAFAPLCIAPANGWRADRILTHGDHARTLVRALGIEQRLPTRGDPIEIEGEAYVEATASGSRTHRKLALPASAHTWATAEGSPAEFSYRVRIDDPSVFTIEAMLHGSEPQLWSIDGRYRVTANPGEGADAFTRTDVITLPLSAGEHVIRALIAPEAGIDSFRLLRRESSAANYLDLIEEIGLEGGAPAAYVSRDEAQRSLADPTFSMHARHFLAQVADGVAPMLLVGRDVDTPVSRPLGPLMTPEF